MMSEIAKGFLTRCFAPDETIAFLLRRERADRPAQRIVRLEQALAPAYLRWLVHENLSGANIYIAANPLRFGSRRRTKDSIASVRHLYIDIDSDGDARVAALQASDAVPSPTAILATSPGKYQALWRVDGFDCERQEAALKQLAIVFGGDPACTDCSRVLRVPGFLNHKYSPAHAVTVEYPCDSIWNPDDFRLDNLGVDAAFPPRGIGRQIRSGKQSHSEADWSWVIAELEHGKDAGKLTRILAERRSDKPNPLYYAQRTVDMASARLWLLEGAPVDDVITMLEVRRHFELPTALCSARAREIATTAFRMIARKKTA
ncbi:RepB family DNA primase [Granulicella sp. dw_53]|uniref:RepB family DNA primase n=1 Tax=Granulicella sp. dw_53 TaxID=2719792 RepID=UPI002104402C|nr:RepB family DNA primase [Granulicella sp. dw_53]